MSFVLIELLFLLCVKWNKHNKMLNETNQFISNKQFCSKYTEQITDLKLELLYMYRAYYSMYIDFAQEEKCYNSYK